MSNYSFSVNCLFFFSSGMDPSTQLPVSPEVGESTGWSDEASFQIKTEVKTAWLLHTCTRYTKHTVFSSCHYRAVLSWTTIFDTVLHVHVVFEIDFLRGSKLLLRVESYGLPSFKS